MAMMKAVRIHRFGGPEVMELEEVPVPQPREDEMLVRVHTASVNPVDYKIRRGGYVGEDKLPLTLGRDGCGVVESCGTRIERFKRGDAIYFLLGPDRGTFAEYTVAKMGEPAPKPAQATNLDAAAVPLAGLTAWQGLFDHGGLKPGQRVLIHGGAGGVGHFAIQFAKVRGAAVLTTVSGQDIAFARELGADQPIDYKTQRFEDIARDIDLVFDLVGGETQDRSWSVLKPGGILVCTVGQPPQDMAARYKVRAVGYRAQPNPAELSEIGRLIDDDKVHPVVSATFPLAQVREAEELLEHGHVRGKIVLTVAA